MRSSETENIRSIQAMMSGSLALGILDVITSIDDLFFPTIAATAVTTGIKNYRLIKEKNKLPPRRVEFQGKVFTERQYNPTKNAIAASVMYSGISTGLFGAGYGLATLGDYIF